MEAASGPSWCSEEHIDFPFSVSRSRHPRQLGLAVLWASRRTLRHRWPHDEVGTNSPTCSVSIVACRSTSLSVSSKLRSSLQLVVLPRVGVGAPRSASTNIEGGVRAIQSSLGCGRSALEAPKSLGGVPTVCLRTLPSAVTNRRRLTSLRRAGWCSFNPPLSSVRALSGP